VVHVSTVNALGVGKPGKVANEDKNFGQAHPTPYVQTKMQADEEVKKWVNKGLNALIVHPGFMLGPYDWKLSSGRMLQAVVDGFVPFAPAGAMSICDVRDVAAGIVTAYRVGKVGRSYILAGYNMTYLDAWRTFRGFFDKEGPHKVGSPFLMGTVGMLGDLMGRLGASEPDFNSASIALGSQYHVFSSDRAIKELGYTLRPLEQTVRDAYEWLSDHHGDMDDE